MYNVKCLPAIGSRLPSSCRSQVGQVAKGEGRRVKLLERKSRVNADVIIK